VKTSAFKALLVLTSLTIVVLHWPQVAEGSEEIANSTIIEVRQYMAQAAIEMEPVRREAMSEMKHHGVVVRKDIIYRVDPNIDPVRNILDLYLPLADAAKPRARPIVLYVHGGAWVAGSKEQALFKPLAFVSNGFVFASMNYPLIPEASLLEMAQGIAESVGWLVRNATDFGGDPTKIFLLGHSAGAHLVSLLGTNESFLERAGVPLTSLLGVISLDTVAYNLPTLIDSANGSFQKQIFKGNEAFFETVSPWHHVSQRLTTPPFLIFYSEGRIDALSQTIPFGEHLRSAGQEAVVLEAKGRNHEALDTKLGMRGDKVTALIQEFLHRHSL